MSYGDRWQSAARGRERRARFAERRGPRADRARGAAVRSARPGHGRRRGVAPDAEYRGARRVPARVRPAHALDRRVAAHGRAARRARPRHRRAERAGCRRASASWLRAGRPRSCCTTSTDGAAENWTIDSFGASALTGELTASVRSFAPDAVTRTLTLTQNGRTVGEQTVEIAGRRQGSGHVSRARSRRRLESRRGRVGARRRSHGRRPPLSRASSARSRARCCSWRRTPRVATRCSRAPRSRP